MMTISNNSMFFKYNFSKKNEFFLFFSAKSLIKKCQFFRKICCGANLRVMFIPVYLPVITRITQKTESRIIYLLYFFQLDLRLRFANIYYTKHYDTSIFFKTQTLQIFSVYGGNFKSLQKWQKILVAICKWSVFGGYPVGSHAQTTISNSSTIFFQPNFAGLLKLPL